MKPTGLLQLSYAGKTGKAEPPSLQQQPPSPVHTAPELSPPYGKFLILLRLGGARGTMGRGNGREPLFSLSPSRHSPRAAVFFLSPGLRPRNLYGQSSTKEAFLLRTPIHSAAVTDSSISLMRHRPNSFESLIMSRIMSNVPFNLNTLRICIVVNEVFKVRHTDLFGSHFIKFATIGQKYVD